MPNITRKNRTVNASHLEQLLHMGVEIAARDMRRHPKVKGKFMVAQGLEEGENPTDNSAYCIVGNNLAELVQEAARYFEID